MPLRGPAGPHESVMKIWLRLPAAPRRPVGQGRAPRIQGMHAARKPGPGLRGRGADPEPTREGAGARPGGRSAASPLTVARNGERSTRAGPAGGAVSGRERHSARRVTLGHAGAEAGTHHLGSRGVRRDLSCRRAPGPPVERGARRSQSLARAAGGPVGPSAVERRGMGF